MDDGVHLVLRVDGQFEIYLILGRQEADTRLFVRMFTVFVNGAEDGAGIGQVNCAIIFHGYEGVCHFAHAVRNVNTGVTA